MSHRVFLFGEAEKGEFCTPFVCQSLPQLAETFGNPPTDSLGLNYAVQTLLFEKELIFFRVKEEGFSLIDYMKGIRLLENRSLFHHLTAICIPGVGDPEIIDAITMICHAHRSLLITTERDFYDFITHR
ncbi:MAG: hypothetical protein RLZZ453_773 [Chlamydiota bacterium]|jgi:hypothetical protein